jgi:hypothetical protein
LPLIKGLDNNGKSPSPEYQEDDTKAEELREEGNKINTEAA